MKCKKCQGENLIMRRNAKNPSATEVVCGDCGAWQKFVGKEEIRLFEIRASARQKKPTNADRIRSMTDEELAQILVSEPIAETIPFCQNKPECERLLETESGVPESMCAVCALDWLQKPVEGEKR